MRIALFSETFPPQRNGVALILDRLVRFLSEQGHEVLVATTRERGPATAPPARVRVVRVPGIPLPRYPDLRIGTPWSSQVKQAVDAFRPDVIHLVTEYSLGLVGLRLAHKLGIPAVASFHTNIPRYLPYYGFGWADEYAWRYLRWFHNRALVTYCPSEAIRQLLLDRGFERVRIWGRGVDTERFSPVRRSEELRGRHGPLDAVQLLYVGRLTPEKDLGVLFEAYRRVRAARSPRAVHLVLVGDGAYSGRVQATAPPGVTFTGYLQGEALAQAYASADVFVFPSPTETLGNVVLEALASGLPVVGAAEGGVLENLRQDVNGLLCPAGDPAAFAHAIFTLVDQPERRVELARRARAWAQQRTWERAFEPLIEGYREALRR